MERPTIYISAVPGELGSFRETIRSVLMPKDIRFEEQLEYPPEFDGVGSTLNAKISRADAVICLIGQTYGAEPISGRDNAPRRSYIQIEYDLACQLGKPVYLFFADGPDSYDQRSSEGEDKRKRQELFRNDLQRRHSDWRPFNSRTDLEAKIGSLPLVLASQRSIGPRLLRAGSDPLIGREAHLEQLDTAWEDGSTHLVVIRGAAGMGKTALVAHWVAEMRRNDWPGVRHQFEWSFDAVGMRGQAQTSDGTASADLFITSALKFYGDRDPSQGSPYERGARLAALIARQRGLLVLDGLEPLQYGPGPRSGELTEPSLAAMLRRLAQSNSGLCILTTRERLTDLDPFYGTGARDWEIPPLPEQAGAALLRAAGIEGWPASLQRISVDVGGHPLALHLIARFIATAHGGDVSQCEPFGFAASDGEVQGGHSVRVMAAIERWLQQRGEHERRAAAVFRLMGLFDRPVDRTTFAAMASGKVLPTVTDTLVGIGDEEWNQAAEILVQVGLATRVSLPAVSIEGYNQAQVEAANNGGHLGSPTSSNSGGASDALEIHSLLRERLGRRLRLENPPAWRELNRRLFEHLRDSAPYWPEGLASLQPLYAAVAHGCRAGLHEEARQLYRDRIRRGAIGPSLCIPHQMVGTGADLGVLGNFFDTPWRRVSPKLAPPEQGWVIGTVACSLRAIGRLADAIEPTHAVLDMAIEQKDWSSAAAAAAGASAVELLIGEVSAAITSAQRSLELADRSADESARIAGRATHADALHQFGQRDQALREFADAEKLQAKLSPQAPRLQGLHGFDYCDALLSIAERAGWQAMLELNQKAISELPGCINACRAVTERAEQTLAWVTRQQKLLEIGLDHLTLARSALYEELIRMAETTRESAVRRMPAAARAHDHLAAAVNGLRRASAIEDLPRSLLTRAWLRFIRGDQKNCRSDLDEAWEMSARAPMRLHLADVHLTRARLFRDREELERARALIERCGFGHRKGQLADADEAARGWS